MIEECPFCGSIRIVETLKDASFCLACESLLKSKPTLFDRITASPEALAEFLVVEYRYRVKDYAYYSTVTGGLYDTKPEAVAATVARLKEVTE